MKLKYILCATMLSVAFAAGAKTGVLVAHYGSSDEDTRQKTIDCITNDIKEAFPGVEVEEAYISPVVRAKLIQKGEAVMSPAEALQKMSAEGIDTIVVQSSTIIDGAEMADVRNAVAENRQLFSEIRIGRPLCYSPDDCEAVVDVLVKYASEPNTAVIFAGHGNNLPSTATYCQLDYMIHDRGVGNVHVSTIEGYPTPQSTITELKRTPQIKNVELRPLLLVCGNHTKTDIAVDFAGELQDEGYTTEVVYKGFAEYPEIRQIYVNRVAEMIESLK